MVEKGLQIRRRSVRFAAEGSLKEIKKSKNNGFGRQVVTHASRPAGPEDSIQGLLCRFSNRGEKSSMGHFKEIETACINTSGIPKY